MSQLALFDALPIHQPALPPSETVLPVPEPVPTPPARVCSIGDVVHFRHYYFEVLHQQPGARIGTVEVVNLPHNYHVRDQLTGKLHVVSPGQIEECL